MQKTENHSQENTMSTLNLIVILLSVYVLLALCIDTFFELSYQITRVLDYIDNGICIFFLFEFCIRFYKAENKIKFMKWGWIDLVSSIPNFNLARAGRALRLIRLLRILRAFRSTKHIVNHIYKNKTSGAFTTVSLVAVLVLIFSTIAILQVETAPNSNIKTAEDALWWSYTTITTVGYGDKYPVTTEGRIIAGILMTVGVGLLEFLQLFWLLGLLKKSNK